VAEVLWRQKGELGKDAMLCLCVPQKTVLEVLRQRKCEDNQTLLYKIIYAPIHLP